MISPMVEKVAEALFLHDRDKPRPGDPFAYVATMYGDTPCGWQELSEPAKNIFRMQACAAIPAMRKPTRAMLNAAAASMSPGKRPTLKRVSVRAKHGIRYRAMIDEALKDG